MDLQTHGGGSVSVSDRVFGAAWNEGLVHQIVTAYLAGGRQGTKAQKTRSEVRGGGAKPWRQKGTGRARAGTSRSPIWTGGGVTFAAKTRDYTQKVNKKMYAGAIRSILSRLAERDALLVVESLDVDEPRTKAMVSRLADLGVEGRVLIVVDEVGESLWLASRNLPNVHLLDVDGIDPVSLVRHPRVVVTTAAVKRLEERLA